MVLGDGYLGRNTFRDGVQRGNWKLDIAHSEKQLPYLEHKKEIANDLFCYELPIRKRVMSANGKQYPVVRMQTRTHSRLSFIGKRIYINGTKRISDWALDNITDQGFAIWYMDDGCLAIRKRKDGYTRTSIILGTYGFPKDDVEKLRNWLSEKGYDFGMHQHKSGGWYLERALSKLPGFIEWLAPHVAPSMEYKFGISTAPNANTTGDDIVCPAGSELPGLAYEGEIKNSGDKVYIRSLGDVTINDYQKGQKLTYERIESPDVELLIDKGKYSSPSTMSQ